LMRARLGVVQKFRLEGRLDRRVKGRHSRSMAREKKCYRGYIKVEVEMTGARGWHVRAMCRCREMSKYKMSRRSGPSPTGARDGDCREIL
jgi:transcription antitermination factor NusG